MTSDCPTGVPTGRRKLAVLASGMAASATLASGSAAFADEAVPVDRVPTIEQAPADKKIDIDIDGDGEFMGEPLDDRPLTPPVVTPPVVIEHEMGVMISEPIAPRPRLQWSVWGRIGLGVATADPTAVPRRLTMTLPEPRQDLIGEAALAADLTLGVTPDGRMRIGAFGELRTTTDPVAGGEVAIEPARWRRHMTPSIVLRAGGNAHVFTGEVGVGYIGTYGSWTRHAVGGRVVTTFNRSLEAPQDWSVTVGLEVEPIGALQALVRAAK